MKSDELTKENINKLVIIFYTKVLNNEKLGPFFVQKLGDDMNSDIWQEHIKLLTEFWYTMLTGLGNYNGRPFPPHAQIMGLNREAFEKWLELFFQSVDKVFDERIANKFKERSSIIASNFMRNLQL
ncbi:group III truncated hemoglobin [Poseidonibacter sp.]|uniref:group III truncated hemoglobin n=1 Tax=Poseidonibacter sp. TaxID=2321188 RepID=UPI003C7517FD